MKRREFITSLGAVAVSRPFAVRAQQRQLFDSHCHIPELARRAFWNNPLALYKVKA